MNKKQKIRHDRKTILKYKEQLEARRKEYGFFADAYSVSGRRSRVTAIGELVLKLLEELEKLNRQKRLLDGTLFWTINEARVRDTDGKKGFQYRVAFRVKSDEPYYTEEEIRDELRETFKKIREETEEIFKEDPGEPAEEQPKEGTET